MEIRLTYGENSTAAILKTVDTAAMISGKYDRFPEKMIYSCLSENGIIRYDMMTGREI